MGTCLGYCEKVKGLSSANWWEIVKFSIGSIVSHIVVTMYGARRVRIINNIEYQLQLKKYFRKAVFLFWASCLCVLGQGMPLLWSSGFPWDCEPAGLQGLSNISDCSRWHLIPPMLTTKLVVAMNCGKGTNQIILLCLYKQLQYFLIWKKCKEMYEGVNKKLYKLYNIVSLSLAFVNAQRIYCL